MMRRLRSISATLWLGAGFVLLPRHGLAAVPTQPAAEQPPPFSGFETVPWAKYTNSAFAADFDGKWIRLEAEFVASTAVSPQRLPEFARGQAIATTADVFFTIRPTGGSAADDFAGVFIAKEMSDPLFTMPAGRPLILYGLGKRMVVSEPGPPATTSEYTLLKVVQLEQVTAEPAPEPVAVAPVPVAAAPEVSPQASREPRAPLVLFGSAPEPGADGVGGVERTVALSIGTGPLPVNTLTLGLSGLGARVMFPKRRVVPFGGLALHTGRATTTYDSGDGSTSYRSGATSLTASGGVRFDAQPRVKGTAVPYGIGAAMLSRASVKDGQVDPQESIDTTGVTVAGVLAGFGMDGFVTSHLSLGAELGGALFTGSGKTDYDEAELTDDDHDEGVASVYTALQLTVWR